MKKMMIGFARIIWHLLWMEIAMGIALFVGWGMFRVGLLPNPNNYPAASLGMAVLLGTMVMSAVLFRRGANLPLGCEAYSWLSVKLDKVTRKLFGDLDEGKWTTSPRGWLSIALYGFVYVAICLWMATILAIVAPVTLLLTGFGIAKLHSAFRDGQLKFWPGLLQWLHKTTRQTQEASS